MATFDLCQASCLAWDAAAHEEPPSPGNRWPGHRPWGEGEPGSRGGKSTSLSGEALRGEFGLSQFHKVPGVSVEGEADGCDL